MKLSSKRKKLSFDFLFVSGPLGYNITGGDQVMMQLASRLSKDGYKVGILLVRKIERHIIFNNKDQIRNYKEFLSSIGLTYRIFSFIFHTKFGLISLNLLRHFRRMGNDLPPLGKITIFVSKHIPSNIFAEKSIAVGWKSAYFVNTINNCKKKFYLVQHDEDDPSYADGLIEAAKITYSFNLKKIIYNRHLLDRFKDDNPVTIRMAPYWKPRLLVPPEKRDNRNILLVLRSGNSKGAEFALQAVEDLKSHANAKFRSFGDYSGTISKNIKHFRWVNKQQLERLMNWAAIFVIPSVIEGYSLTAAEAASAGCAIVTTDSVGVREFIVNNLNGYVVKIRSSSEIAAAISKLLDHPKLRIDMAYAAYNTLENYNFDMTYDDFKSKILI